MNTGRLYTLFLKLWCEVSAHSRGISSFISLCRNDMRRLNENLMIINPWISYSSTKENWPQLHLGFGAFSNIQITLPCIHKSSSCLSSENNCPHSGSEMFELAAPLISSYRRPRWVAELNRSQLKPRITSVARILRFWLERWVLKKSEKMLQVSDYLMSKDLVFHISSL